MTRKHFVALAEAFARALAASTNTDYRLGGASAAAAVAFELERGNPRFDRQRFLRACGVPS